MSLPLPPGPAWLFVPGSRPDRWAKAAARADTVVVDLENAVAPRDKDTAREAVGSVTDHVDPARLVVRVNPPGTPWHAGDVDAVRQAGVSTVMVPKVHGRDDLDRIAAALPGVALVALCETATSIVHAEDVAASPSCCALMWGGEDLAVDLGGRTSHLGDGQLAPAMAYARTRLRFGARSAGVAAVDAPVLRLDRPSWVTAEAAAAASMGYHAKACVHPDQVPLVRAAFAPSAEEIARARVVIAAAESHAEEPGSSDVPVFALDGQMVDYPVVALARRVLAHPAHT